MTSSLKKGLTLLRAPGNALAFAARRRLRWRRGCPLLVNEDKAALFDYLAGDERARAEARERELCERHDLAGLRSRSTRLDYRDNLWLLDSLEQLLGDAGPKGRDGVVRLLDVGSKNFNYALALDRFCRNGQRGEQVQDVELLGIEIDGHGVYRDLRSRADHAEAYVRQTGNPKAVYRVADFLEQAQCWELQGFDVVTLFYPFLTRHALLAWGLPLSCFRPRQLLARSLAALRPGGLLVVFSQTSDERDRLHEWLEDLGSRASVSKSLRSKLVQHWHQTRDRWGTLVWKEA